MTCDCDDPGREGNCEDGVAAVLVSIGGGRIGAAARDEVEEEVVAVDRVDDVEAFREMLGVMVDDGSRGKTGKGGVGGAELVGVGMGCIVAAMTVGEGESGCAGERVVGVVVIAWKRKRLQSTVTVATAGGGAGGEEGKQGGGGEEGVVARMPEKWDPGECIR